MKKVDLYTSILKKLSSQKEQNIASLSFLNEIIYYTTRTDDTHTFIKKIVDVISKYLGNSAIYLLKNKALYKKYSTLNKLPDIMEPGNYDEFIDILLKKSSRELNIKQSEAYQDIKQYVAFHKKLSVLPLSVKNAKQPIGILIIDVDLNEVELTKLQALNTAMVLISNSISYSLLIKSDKSIERKVLKLILKIMMFDDLSTYRHSLRVEKYSLELAKLLSLPKDKIKRLRLSALLHDLGKITIPYHILHKEEKLTKDEFEIIKQHTVVGYRLLKDIHFFKESLPDILSHHEKIDGSGYPNKIKTLDLVTQILAVADIIDAIASTRSYKDDKIYSYITKELENLKGKYDDNVIETAIKFINSNRFLSLKKRFKVLEAKKTQSISTSIGSLQEKIHQLKAENQNLSKQLRVYKNLLEKSQKTIEEITLKTKTVSKDSEIYKAIIKNIFESIKPVSIVFVKLQNDTLNIVRVKGEPMNLENSIQLLSNKKLFSAISTNEIFISRKMAVFPLFEKEAACAFLSKDSVADEEIVKNLSISLKKIVKSRNLE